MKLKKNNFYSKYRRLLQIVGLVALVLLGIVLVAKLISTHTNYHTYKEEQLAKIIRNINIPNQVIGSNYKGGCRFYNSDPEPVAYACDSKYNAVYSGGGNICNDYNQLHNAMARAGYTYDWQTKQALHDTKNNPAGLSVVVNFANEPSTADCQQLIGSSAKNPSLKVSYVSKQFTTATRGDGILSCYFPAKYWWAILEGGNNYGYESNTNTFDCVVEVYAST